MKLYWLYYNNGVTQDWWKNLKKETKKKKKKVFSEKNKTKRHRKMELKNFKIKLTMLYQ